MLQVQDVKDIVTRLIKKVQSQASASETFGLYIQQNAITVVNPVFDDQSQITSLTLHSDKTATDSEFAMHLRTLRDDWDLTGKAGCWVLGKENYQTLLIDTPDVKPQEFRAAAIWQAKDLLKYPIEDCIVDVFSPSKTISIHANKLYVVAAKKSLLMKITETFEKVEVPITTIITEEFALKNLMLQLIEYHFGAILLRHDDNTYIFLVIGNGDILFTRNIASNVVAELYRSFEFYTITLKQDKINTLYLIDVEDDIQTELTDFFTANDYPLEIKTFADILIKYNLDQDKLTLPNLLAIGGGIDCLHR